MTVVRVTSTTARLGRRTPGTGDRIRASPSESLPLLERPKRSSMWGPGRGRTNPPTEK